MKQLIFEPGNVEHERHYELAHVLMHTNRLQLTEAERARLGRLQDEWEARGTASDDEKVVDDRDFSVMRHTLDGEKADADGKVLIDLEDAVHALLLKLVEKNQLAGYIVRHAERLRDFLKAAQNVKYTPRVMS